MRVRIATRSPYLEALFVALPQEGGAFRWQLYVHRKRLP